MERNLSLKVGAPAILTRNLYVNLYNGLIGKVLSAEKDKPPVFNFDGRIVTLDRIRFVIYDPQHEKFLAVCYQYPMKLAFDLLCTERRSGLVVESRTPEREVGV